MLNALPYFSWNAEDGGCGRVAVAAVIIYDLKEKKIPWIAAILYKSVHATSCTCFCECFALHDKTGRLPCCMDYQFRVYHVPISFMHRSFE